MKKFVYISCVILTLIFSSGCKEDGPSENESSGPPHTPWSSNPSRPWTAVTPTGINIIADMATVEQYETTWEGIFHWEKIDWVTLDEEFEFYRQYFCYELDWDCKHVVPSDLTVFIKSWDGRCKDEETPSQPREIYEYINDKWQCIDGWYYRQVVYFHLGDDPGIDHTVVVSEDPPAWVGYDAFQESVYSHELLHFFQTMAGLPFSETYKLPGLLMGYILHLPEEEIEEEKE